MVPARNDGSPKICRVFRHFQIEMIEFVLAKSLAYVHLDLCLRSTGAAQPEMVGSSKVESGQKNQKRHEKGP